MHQWKNPTLVYRNAFDLNNNVIKMVWSAPNPNPTAATTVNPTAEQHRHPDLLCPQLPTLSSA
jgi:hypothetical protein